MRKTVVILSALLLLASLAFAGEKSADQKEKANCAEKCKMAKSATACPSMKADAKTASDEAKSAGCAMHADAKTASAETKSDDSAVPAEAQKAVEAAKAEGEVATATGENVKAEGEAKAEAHTCGTEIKCKELTQFHAAMHPMALAMGFEGDEKPDMAKFRALYPMMKEKTEALAKMPVDENVIKDTKVFTEKRAELVKFVDELGKTCKGKDDSKINPAFEKVHESYIQLAVLAK